MALYKFYYDYYYDYYSDEFQAVAQKPFLCNVCLSLIVVVIRDTRKY